MCNRGGFRCAQYRMCGRFYLVAPVDQIIRAFGVSPLLAPKIATPRFNIAPQQRILMVRSASEPKDHSKDQARELTSVSWGFVPAWSKSPVTALKTINARAESAFDTPMFRDAIRKRRGLVPADGWYEWKTDEATGAKAPYLFRVLDDAGLPAIFALAALWERWVSPDAVSAIEHESCALMTTSANQTCAPIHNRMPLILPSDSWQQWLDSPASEARTLRELMVPFPRERIQATRVSSIVNNARNELPACIEPVTNESLRTVVDCPGTPNEFIKTHLVSTKAGHKDAPTRSNNAQGGLFHQG